MTTMRRTIAVIVAVTIIIFGAYAAASISSEIGLNFQVTSRIAPMYNLWFHRYMSPTGVSDCQWIGARGLIVFGDSQQDITCFHQANPKIAVVDYLDRGVQTSDPLAQALWSVESAWLHWQNGSRAYFTFNSFRVYLPNPSSTNVRSYEASNLITQWKSKGVDGLFIDDGYYPCKINNLYRICSGGSPLAEFNSGDYQSWVQAWSNWANWVKSQMGKPFHIYPNGVDWYTTINSTVLSAWLGGMDGVFLEYYPRPYTYSDEISWYYQMQSEYYAANSKAIIDFFPYSGVGNIPSLYWLAAYYLLAKNFTTNNLYASPPFSYPVPASFCCEGWNSAVWDKLVLGNPQGASSIVDAFGDGTATLYIRLFQWGIVVAMQHRLATDTRTLTVNLPGAYANVTGGTAVTNITMGVNNAFIGVIPGHGQLSAQAVPTFSLFLPYEIGSFIALILTFSRRRVRN